MAAGDEVGWAIVGCGRVAERRLAPAFARLDDSRLVAVCSRTMARARQFADRIGADRGYDSLDALLADPSIQVVYIATPNALHAEQALRCLSAGRHVVVDKPMALSSA